MIPIISIVGKSDSGKTTLIEKLIPEDQEIARVGEKVKVQLLDAPFKSSP